jgi:hypothetical protein
VPGDVLIAEYSVELQPDDRVQAVECSVIWLTSGKGEEDIGVHFFQRRPKSTLEPAVLKRPHRLSTVLPPSPLSYDGAIVQIRWLLRIRIFFAGGVQFTEDCPFRLGKTDRFNQYDLTSDHD